MTEWSSFRYHQVIKNDGAGDAKCALMGFSCDEGGKAENERVGVKQAPDALRGVLANTT